MTDTAATRRLGVIYMIVASTAWSTGGVFARHATTDLATTMFWRTLFAVLGVLAVLVLFQGVAGLASFRRLGWPGLITAALGAVASFVTVPALQMTSVAHVVVIYATAPFLAGGIAWIVLGQKPRRFDMIASVIALAGAVLMLGFSQDGGLWGDLLSLVLTLCMAGMMVMFRRYPTVPSLPTAITAFGLATFACLFLTPDLTIAPDQLQVLLAFGLVSSAAGTAFFLMGSRLLRPVETAILSALETPLAPLWVWLFLGDVPGTATFIGGGIVMAAVIWHGLQSAKLT
jgi:drug/metabolite transporter (DMT)-like permease